MNAPLTQRSIIAELEGVNASIRTEPLAATHRLALAHLKLIQGDYPKALQQLQLACQFDSELTAEAQLVKALILAEQVREAVFAGKILPDLLYPAQPWLENMIAALRETGEKAAALRQQALNDAPASAGSYGEEPTAFEWIADGDDRLGPIVEIILGGTYYWIPFDKVETLLVPPPKRVTELVWAPVDVKLAGRPPAIAYMPARYIPPVEGCTDAFLTGAETQWVELPDGEGGWKGYGRKTWHVDGEPLGVFEAGTIRIGQ